MAKITTVIDIGSNSIRMVVFKKTSRFGFFLLNETKLKVQISKGSYENNGYLQKEQIEKAFETLKSFVEISKKYKARKILCIATSALRDAPNKNEFINKVKKELKLNIKVIDGKKEAFLGGIATLNLLPQKDFLTLDIGGGSTEIALIKNKKIINYYSIDIGTIRLKELFIDKNNYEGAKKYILEKIKTLPNNFNLEQMVVLGGTSRSISKAIIKKDNYPLNLLHGFEYRFEDYKEYIKDIIYTDDIKNLKKLFINRDRFDTINSGALIFYTILEYFNIKNIITSGVGIREGLFLFDMLRNQNYKFPSNFNVSVRTMLDNFSIDDKITKYATNNINKLFDILKIFHNLDDSYKKYLSISAKLSQIGVMLNYYKNSDLSSEFILHGLKYGFTHKDRLLISAIIKYSKNPFEKKIHPLYLDCGIDGEKFRWLSFIQKINNILLSEKLEIFRFDICDKELKIYSKQNLFIVKSELNNLKIPKWFCDLKLKILEVPFCIKIQE